MLLLQRPLDGSALHAGYCLPHPGIGFRQHHKGIGLSLLQYAVARYRINSTMVRDKFSEGIELIFYLKM